MHDLKKIDNLEELTGIPNIIELTSTELSFETLEKGWTKETRSSRAKAQEWLLRHAIGMAVWYQVLDKKSEELAQSPTAAFKSWAEEVHNYSADYVNKLRRAGEFVLKIRTGIEGLKSVDASLLPTSYTTLLEYSSLSDEDLKRAYNEGMITPEITSWEVKDWKAQLKQERREAKVKTEAKHKEHTSQVEEEVLYFKYDDAMPEWILEKIEDLAAELGKEKVGPTLKFPDKLANGQDCTWVCVLMNNKWSATQYIKGGEPKDEKQEKYKHEKTQADKEREGYESFFAKYLAVFGIDIEEGKIKAETIKWLLDGFRRAHHPDKGEHNAELTQTAVIAAKKLEAFARENSK
jgi:hypothetical protein